MLNSELMPFPKLWMSMQTRILVGGKRPGRGARDTFAPLRTPKVRFPPFSKVGRAR